MPSRIVLANVAAQLVAAAVRNGVHKPTSITIDNSLGAAAHTIRVQDSFTPDVSNAVAAPVVTTIDRHQISVPVGDLVVLEEKDLERVKCLGSLSIIAEAVTGTDPLCAISVGYKTE